MAQTKEGAAKCAATNKAKYGEDYYKVLGKMGGSAKTKTKGFGSSPERARKAGRLGGSISRRNAKKPSAIKKWIIKRRLEYGRI